MLRILRSGQRWLTALLIAGIGTVFAVPRSIARSLENQPRIGSRIMCSPPHTTESDCERNQCAPDCAAAYLSRRF